MIDEKRLIEELSKNSIFEKITNAEGKNVIEIIKEQPKVNYLLGDCVGDCKNCWKTKLVNPQWIPCSERLPEKREGEFHPTMYVTTKYGNVQIGFYRVDDKQWYILGDETDDEPIMVADNYVIAWQDEPKPYQQ